MFAAPQLAEISQRFQADIDNFRVLLQEEGLPARSAGCLEEVTTRLGSDPRFRQDVAFLVRSMLCREREEPGSMEVLGALLIAAGGTAQHFDDPQHQELVRGLLRFVIQQRRAAGTPVLMPHAQDEGPRLHAATPISARFPVDPEPPSPVAYSVGSERIAGPSLLPAEAEPISRSTGTRTIAAVVAVVVVSGAGLLIHLRPDVTTRERPAAHTAGSPAYSADSEPDVIVNQPHSARFKRNLSKRLPEFRFAHPSPAPPPAPNTPGAVAPKIVERLETGHSGPTVNEPANSAARTPGHLEQASPGVSLRSSLPGQRSAPGPIDVSKVFAHPEATDAAVASQIGPPVFRRKDPVLIARNTPPASFSKPELQGTVHMGSAGTMASSLVYSPEPEYPARAIATGVQGQVTVRAVVGPDGNVIDASVVSGPPLLREAALDAVGRWRYRPYEQDGKPVKIATTAILDFQLPAKTGER